MSSGMSNEARLKLKERTGKLGESMEEKKQKKKTQTLQKKPFGAGVARNPVSFVPPPPRPVGLQKGLRPFKPTAKDRNTKSKHPNQNPAKVKNETSTVFDPVVSMAPSTSKGRTFRLPLTRQLATEYTDITPHKLYSDPSSVEEKTSVITSTTSREEKSALNITYSMEKDNENKEIQSEIQEGLLDEDTFNMESVDHFRKQLSLEFKCMTEMCDTWGKISAQTALPESVQEAVLSAVGQARLLMSQKLAQFAAGVERCDEDLPGALIQVEEVNHCYKNLEERRSRDLVEEESSAPVQASGKRSPSSPAARTPPSHGTSSIEAAIAAPRQAKQEEKQCASGDCSSPASAPLYKTPNNSTPRRQSSSSSAGPAPLGNPANNTLLKEVLSSEANKVSASEFSSTRFSNLRTLIISKSMESEGFALLPKTPENILVNQFATPGRSINVVSIKSGNKSIKTVILDESEERDTQYQSCIGDRAQSTISGVKHTPANVVHDKENSPLLDISSVINPSQRKKIQNFITSSKRIPLLDLRSPQSQ